MNFKEIHYYLLSLLVRGLGFWLLFALTVAVNDFAAEVIKWFQNDGNYYAMPPKEPMVTAGLLLIVRIAVSVYFILGAPPLLSLATKDREKKD